MPKPLNLISQIKEVCQITRAEWAVIIGRIDETWGIQIVQGLNKQGQVSLQRYLNTPTVNAWVSGAILSGRGRWRKFSETAFIMDCERLYLFPTQSTDSAMIVGADELDKNGQAFWRILASFINGPQLDAPQIPASEPTTPQLTRLTIGEYHNLSGLLDRIGEIIQQMIPCEALWIAIKHAEVLTIEKVRNGADGLEKTDIQPEEAASIFSLCRSGYAVREINSPGWSRLHRSISSTTSQFWLGIPILHGQTTIGLISIFGSKQYSQNELDKITQLARHVSPVLSGMIEQVETTRQLACFNRFNDVVLAATQGENLQDVARQLVRLLADSIQTPLVGLLLPTTDRKFLHQYGAEPVTTEPVYSVHDTLAGHVFETGIPLQIRDARKEIVSYRISPGILSELAVPLIYRGKVTGVLELESPKANAFNRDAVEFLTLVAGYMAGFLEFLHLQQSTEIRASNLSLIYNLVQKIGGLSDIREITQVSAELLAEHFVDSRVEIAILEDNDPSRSITASARNSKLEIKDTASRQTASEYLALYSANQMIEEDLENGQSYPWDSKQRFAHQILLPIRNHKRLFGLINVTGLANQKFSYNDILMVEVVTGVLSGHLPVVLHVG
jgi:GAF domain-containing protein